MNEERSLSCFHSLNNKKMLVSRENSNFACIQRRAYVGLSLFFYYHKFGQHLQKLR